MFQYEYPNAIYISAQGGLQHVMIFFSAFFSLLMYPRGCFRAYLVFYACRIQCDDCMALQCLHSLLCIAMYRVLIISVAVVVTTELCVSR